MSEAQRNFLVGLFMLCGLGALMALLVLFSKNAAFRMQPAQYTLRVQFDRATGIREGRQVTVSGIQIARVSGVQFVDPEHYTGGVLVDVMFDRNPNLTDGTKARTIEPGLGMGLPPIELDPGPAGAPLLANGSVIRGDIRSAVESLLPGEVVAPFSRSAEQIGTAAEKLEPVLDALYKMLEPRTPQQVDAADGPDGNLASAATRVDEAFRHFNTVLGDPQTQSRLKEAIDNFYAVSVDARQAATDVRTLAGELRELSPTLKQTLQRTEQTVANIDGQVTDVSRKVQGNLDLLSGTLQNLQTVSARIERGEGTLGLLTTDAKLYEATVLTVQRLAAAAEDLRLLIQEWQKGRIKVAL